MFSINSFHSKIKIKEVGSNNINIISVLLGSLLVLHTINYSEFSAVACAFVGYMYSVMLTYKNVCF